MKENILMALGCIGFGVGWYLMRQARQVLGSKDRKIIEETPNPYRDGVGKTLRVFFITAGIMLIYAYSTKQWVFLKMVALVAVLGTLLAMPFLVRARANRLMARGVNPAYTRRLTWSWYLSTGGFIMLVLSVAR